jgi:hypothetical protein
MKRRLEKKSQKAKPKQSINGNDASISQSHEPLITDDEDEGKFVSILEIMSTKLFDLHAMFSLIFDLWNNLLLFCVILFSIFLFIIFLKTKQT